MFDEFEYVEKKLNRRILTNEVTGAAMFKMMEVTPICNNTHNIMTLLKNVNMASQLPYHSVMSSYVIVSIHCSFLFGKPASKPASVTNFMLLTNMLYKCNG